MPLAAPVTMARRAAWASAINRSPPSWSQRQAASILKRYRTPQPPAATVPQCQDIAGSDLLVAHGPAIVGNDARMGARMADALPPHTVARTHHVGMSVASLDRALAFWEGFLGAPRRWRTLLESPISAAMSAIPAWRSTRRSSTCRAASCWSCWNTGGRQGREPGCHRQSRQRASLPCRRRLRRRLRARGGTRRAPGRERGPVRVTDGPNAGARASYLRIHDGITLELFQPAAAVGAR